MFRPALKIIVSTHEKVRVSRPERYCLPLLITHCQEKKPNPNEQGKRFLLARQGSGQSFSKVGLQATLKTHHPSFRRKPESREILDPGFRRGDDVE